MIHYTCWLQPPSMTDLSSGGCIFQLVWQSSPLREIPARAYISTYLLCLRVQLRVSTFPQWTKSLDVREPPFNLTSKALLHCLADFQINSFQAICRKQAMLDLMVFKSCIGPTVHWAISLGGIWDDRLVTQSVEISVRVTP